MYKHTQIGWLILILFGVGILLTGFFGVVYLDWGALSCCGSLMMCVILFATLTVIVNDKFVEVRFGVGLIRKKFSLEEINSCTVVRNYWWDGWGIRKIPKGWLFSIAGLDAVELVMKNGKVYRIGTDEPQTLNEVIQKKLNKEK